MKLFEEFFDDIEQDELIDSNSSEDITIEDLDKEIYLYDDNNEINLNKLDLFFNHCIYITDYLIKQDDYKIIIDFNGYMTIKEATKFCNIFNRYIDYSIFDYLISPVIIDKEFIQSRYSNGTLDLSGVVFDNGAFFIENYIDDYININYIDLRKADTSKLVYLSFKNLENLKEIYGIEDIDVSNFKSTSSMFYDCNSLTSLNLNKWNVSNVKETKHMFYRCELLEELNISDWDVSNVKDMSYMFNGCESLEELNISDWNVSNVKETKYMFYRCESLKELNISNWNVSNVKDMSYMFSGCELLKELNINTWDISNVIDMNYMFNCCDSLIELNISNWDVSNVKNMDDMFTWCVSLTNIIINKTFDKHLDDICSDNNAKVIYK